MEKFPSFRKSIADKKTPFKLEMQYIQQIELEITEFPEFSSIIRKWKAGRLPMLKNINLVAFIDRILSRPGQIRNVITPEELEEALTAFDEIYGIDPTQTRNQQLHGGLSRENELRNSQIITSENPNPTMRLDFMIGDDQTPYDGIPISSIYQNHKTLPYVTSLFLMCLQTPEFSFIDFPLLFTKERLPNLTNVSTKVEILAKYPRSIDMLSNLTALGVDIDFSKKFLDIQEKFYLLSLLYEMDFPVLKRFDVLAHPIPSIDDNISDESTTSPIYDFWLLANDPNSELRKNIQIFDQYSDEEKDKNFDKKSPTGDIRDLIFVLVNYYKIPLNVLCDIVLYIDNDDYESCIGSIEQFLRPGRENVSLLPNLAFWDGIMKVVSLQMKNLEFFKFRCPIEYLFTKSSEVLIESSIPKQTPAITTGTGTKKPNVYGCPNLKQVLFAGIFIKGKTPKEVLFYSKLLALIKNEGEISWIFSKMVKLEKGLFGASKMPYHSLDIYWDIERKKVKRYPFVTDLNWDKLDREDFYSDNFNGWFSL